MQGTDRTLRSDLHNPATGGTSFKGIEAFIEGRETDLIDSDPWLNEDDELTGVQVTFRIPLDPEGAAQVVEWILDGLKKDEIGEKWASLASLVGSVGVDLLIDQVSARVI